jgi:hypothetical protein
MNRLQQRLADLEKALAPNGRHFAILFKDGEPAPHRRPSRLRRSEPSMASPRMTSCTKLSLGSPKRGSQLPHASYAVPALSWEGLVGIKNPPGGMSRKFRSEA